MVEVESALIAVYIWFGYSDVNGFSDSGPRSLQSCSLSRISTLSKVILCVWQSLCRTWCVPTSDLSTELCSKCSAVLIFRADRSVLPTYVESQSTPVYLLHYYQPKIFHFFFILELQMFTLKLRVLLILGYVLSFSPYYCCCSCCC